MFRKPNKTTSKTIKFYRNSYFRFPFIFRHFKCPKWSDLLLLAVDSLVVFVLRGYILKVHVLVSSEHKVCQI